MIGSYYFTGSDLYERVLKGKEGSYLELESFELFSPVYMIKCGVVYMSIICTAYNMISLYHQVSQWRSGLVKKWIDENKTEISIRW